MKRSALVILFALLASGPVLGGSCIAPPPITAVPDGATASEEAMVAALNAIRAYDTAVKKYTHCMEARAVTGRLRMPRSTNSAELLKSSTTNCVRSRQRTPLKEARATDGNVE